MYHLSYCPYCHRLKKFLEDNEVTFEVIDVTTNLSLKQKIKDETGHPTFPQLLINNTFVGDCSSVIENFDAMKDKYNL